MKKVLLTSTALIAFGGMASAQVSDGISITGNAELGAFGSTATIDHSQDGAADTDATLSGQFWQSIDMDIVYTGETDGGLQFGADFDIDEADNLGNNTDDMGTTVFISSDFGTLTLGDTDGAIDFVLDDMGFLNPGSINDAETVHLGYQGGFLDGQGDGQILRYDYSFDAFTFAGSLEQHDDCVGGGQIVNLEGPGTPDNGDGCDDTDLTWGVGFGYDFEFAGGSVGLGIGYQQAGSVDSVLIVSNDVDDTGSINDLAGVTVVDPTTSLLDDGETEVGSASMIGVGASVTSDTGFGAAFTYTSTEFENVDDNLTHIGIGGGYSFDAFSVHANYGQYEIEDYSFSGYGLAAGYDLGGGASLLFGYSASTSDDFDFDLDADDDADEFDASVYSLGISMAF